MKTTNKHLSHRLIHAALAGVYGAVAVGLIDKGIAAGLAAGCYGLLAIV
jgi:hypothetical protein